MITVPKAEYAMLKRQAKHANIDREFLKELVSSLADIKAGRVIRVR
ncbi:MAG: hypothetical protein NUV57_02985 [archaeon]|nr:hypothetical protein [archaeon]